MISVYDGPRGERGPSGTQVNLSLSLGASTDIGDRPATATDGQTWALLGNGTTTVYVWVSGDWAEAGKIGDSGVLSAGAQMYPTSTAGLAATNNGDLFLVATEPGVAIYQNAAGTAALRGWVGEVLYDDFNDLATSGYQGFPEDFILRTRREGAAYIVKPDATDQHVTTAGGTKLYETGVSFTALNRFKAAVARGEVYTAGRMVFVGGEVYTFLDDGNTDISGLPGWSLVLGPDLYTRLAAIEDQNLNARLESVEDGDLIRLATEAYLDDITGARDAATTAASEAQTSSSTAKGHADDAAESESEVQRHLTDAETAAQTSVSEATKAEAARDLADAAADAAAIGAQGVYRTIASGLAATADTDTFIVATSDGWILYTNSAGVETNPSATYPSLTKLRDEIEENNRTLAVSQPRPAELLSRYTSAKTGDRTGPAISGAVVTDGDGYGKCVDVGPAVVVALRDRIWINDRGETLVRAKFKVQANTCDSEGEPIYFGVAWLNADYTEHAPQAETLFYSGVTWESDGWISVEETIGGLGVAPPSGAVYAVPFIQTSGTDGVTRIALLEGNAGQLAAPNLIFPPDFAFPGDSIPFFAEVHIVHVAEDGSDALLGQSRRQAVATVERANEIAAATPGNKFAVYVHPGVYTTDGHIDVPDNVSAIDGVGGQRSVRFRPTSGNEVKNVFRGGDGFMLRNISGEGWQVDDFDNPSEGFLCSFRPGATIYRALYVDHCVMYRGQQPEFIPSPLDPDNGNPAVPKGPGIALADGSIVAPDSPFPQIMIEASTTSAPNGVGYVVKGNAFINGLNTISIWPHKHFMAMDGGEMLLNNCACQFGDWTLWSEGSMDRIIVPNSGGPLAANGAAATAVDGARSAIVDAMWNATVAAGFSGVNEATSRRDADALVTAMQYDLQSGTQETTGFFLRGLYPAGIFVAPAAVGAFVAGWEGMRTAMVGLSISAAAKAMIEGLFDILVDTVQAPTFQKQPSKISATAHQFNFPFAGVNRRAFSRIKRSVPDTVMQRDLGQVIFSGLDDSGTQYFTGGALVNPRTGKFEGPPVGRTINPLARRAAIISGGQ